MKSSILVKAKSMLLILACFVSSVNLAMAAPAEDTHDDGKARPPAQLPEACRAADDEEARATPLVASAAYLATFVAGVTLAASGCSARSADNPELVEAQ